MILCTVKIAYCVNNIRMKGVPTMYSGFGQVMPLQNGADTNYINWSKAKIAEYIAVIKNPDIKQVTQLAFSKVAEKFWVVPASSSGKYHPCFAQGLSGLARHTIAAAHFCERNLRANNTLNEYQRDICRAAILLHDACKSGVHFESEHTLFEHPVLVAQLMLGEVLNNTQMQIWYDICQTISSHMGIWNVMSDRDAYNSTAIDRIKAAFSFFKPLQGTVPTTAEECKEYFKLPLPETEMQKLVAQSDYDAADSAVMLSLFDSQIGAWR